MLRSDYSALLNLKVLQTMSWSQEEPTPPGQVVPCGQHHLLELGARVGDPRPLWTLGIVGTVGEGRAGPSDPSSSWHPGRLWPLSVPDEACSGRPHVSLCAFQVWSSVSSQNPGGAAFFPGSKPVSPRHLWRCFCSSARLGLRLMSENVRLQSHDSSPALTSMPSACADPGTRCKTRLLARHWPWLYVRQSLHKSVQCNGSRCFIQELYCVLVKCVCSPQT